jgi:hypothetical protein
MDDKQKVIERFMTAYGNRLTKERAEEIIFATAYHEAGHAAIHAFLGDDYIHFESLSVVPDEGSTGRIMRMGISPVVVDHDGDPSFVSWDKARAKCRMIFCLSGPVAEAIAQDMYFSLVSEDVQWDSFLYESYDDWLESSDLGKAWSMAEALQSKTWPPFRVMAQMEKWTEEVLRYPEVWEVVETLAGMLINNGVILPDEYFPVGYKIYGRKFTNRIWKRRLLPMFQRKAA